MLSPGVYTLAATAITVAQTGAAQTATTGLAGMSAANLTAELLGGTGGTSVSALVQTSFDAGVTWLDVARFDWNPTDSPSEVGLKYCVVHTNETFGITPYHALAAEGYNDGLLGDRLRAVLTTVGTFISTTIDVRAAIH